MIEKIRKLLREKKLTQGELERLALLPGGRISKWDGGLGKPSAPAALRIARALGVSVDYLVDDDQDEPIPAASPRSEEERRVLWLADQLGFEEAVRRLTLSGSHAPIAGRSLGAHPLPRALDPPPSPPGSAGGDAPHGADKPPGKRAR